jgi:hypothetical protein
MLEQIKNIFGRRRPTALSVASEELYMAELKLLEAQTAQEWAQSNVEYQLHRIARLRQFIWDQERGTQPQTITDITHTLKSVA